MTHRPPPLGAASGLIKELRGEAPFDGSHFPRLPWGGNAVADSDIQFISDWIDDGCPEHDHVLGTYEISGLEARPTFEELQAGNVEVTVKDAYDVYPDSPNEYKYQHGELKQRMNIDCMTEDQLQRLRYAFRQLYKLNSYTTRDTLDIYRFGYEYVKSTYIIPVGLAAPVGRFTSQPIEIPETVRSTFRQAEVRLHRVPQLPRSCFIRIFLNRPDATANTPINDRCYAGYIAIFGHGPCYGGPGHCDLPPYQPRQYDLRPRNHNTPRNHRVNITSCAKRLFDAGATSLQVTLVVVGVDYEEDPELLRLDGVSLNFLD